MVAVIVRAVVIGMLVPIVHLASPITILPFYLAAALTFGWALQDARSGATGLLLRWTGVAVGAGVVAWAGMRVITAVRQIDGGALRYDLILYGYGAVVFVLVPAAIGLGVGALLGRKTGPGPTRT